MVALISRATNGRRVIDRTKWRRLVHEVQSKHDNVGFRSLQEKRIRRYELASNPHPPGAHTLAVTAAEGSFPGSVYSGIRASVVTILPKSSAEDLKAIIISMYTSDLSAIRHFLSADQQYFC